MWVVKKKARAAELESAEPKITTLAARPKKTSEKSPKIHKSGENNGNTQHQLTNTMEIKKYRKEERDEERLKNRKVRRHARGAPKKEKIYL